jgi:lysophospholipase L1-like esterase
MLNLVFLGDSLTEGVPHFNGETDTMPFMVNQQFPGATYIKLGYRGQTSSYIREKFDTTLFWDGCHLFPKAYQIVANLVAAAIRSLSTT